MCLLAYSQTLPVSGIPVDEISRGPWHLKESCCTAFGKAKNHTVSKGLQCYHWNGYIFVEFSEKCRMAVAAQRSFFDSFSNQLVNRPLVSGLRLRVCEAVSLRPGAMSAGRKGKQRGRGG